MNTLQTNNTWCCYGYTTTISNDLQWVVWMSLQATLVETSQVFITVVSL